MKRYVKASFNNPIPDWLRNDKGALKALSEAGIDLRNATFSPEKTGKVAEQYVAYKLDFGYRHPTIYIPGLYGDNEYERAPDGTFAMLKYFTKKELPIVDTVYINKAANAKPRRDHYQDPRYDEFGNYGGQYFSVPYGKTEGEWSEAGRATGRRGWEQRDKSGYVIPKPENRLIEFYASEAGTEKLAAKVEQIYNDLVALKDEIFTIDFATFGKDYNGDYDYSSTAYGNIMSVFGQAIRSYKLALNRLERVKQYGGMRGLGVYDTKEAFNELRAVERRIAEIREGIKTERF